VSEAWQCTCGLTACQCKYSINYGKPVEVADIKQVTLLEQYIELRDKLARAEKALELAIKYIKSPASLSYEFTVDEIIAKFEDMLREPGK
jgi:hypothetical protein